jgi:hypothetical protein
MPPSPTKPISLLITALAQNGFDVSPLTPHRVWAAAVSCRFSAHYVDGRWRFTDTPEDVALIGQALGLSRAGDDIPTTLKTRARTTYSAV